MAASAMTDRVAVAGAINGVSVRFPLVMGSEWKSYTDPIYKGNGVRMEILH